MRKMRKMRKARLCLWREDISLSLKKREMMYFAISTGEESGKTFFCLQISLLSLSLSLSLFLSLYIYIYISLSSL
jgi:hypothetical protein